MNVGVLAVQGAFLEHEKTLAKLNVPSFEIREKIDLKNHMDALILPGGESTVQGKLLRDLGLFPIIKEKIDAGLPVFGTCAGLLLLAKNIVNDDNVYFSSMDIVAVRNAYGRQLGSFYTESDFGELKKIPMTFIRAPYIESVGNGVRILSVVDGRIVAARQKNILVTSFHPELNDDLRAHEYFLEIVRNSRL